MAAREVSREPTDIVPYTLRFREALREQLENEAQKNKTSLNTEIIRRLEVSFQAENYAMMRRDVVNAVKSTIHDVMGSYDMFPRNGRKLKPVRGSRR
jgi:glucosamine 6-phosphate synthetase-like amidotransferase/phosphosugar isomerase protein